MQYRINHNKVISQAEQIKQLSKDFEVQIAKLENLLAKIKGEWYGPASAAFQQQLVILIADMKTMRFYMSSVSSTIKNVADKIQQEDEQAASETN